MRKLIQARITNEEGKMLQEIKKSWEETTPVKITISDVIRHAIKTYYNAWKKIQK